jgi:hypothetical protein
MELPSSSWTQPNQPTIKQMAADRSIRCLSALSGASSSRVLNLAAIALAQTDNANHREAPLFQSKVINGSIILKHRLRADETDHFTDRRALATKVIVPFQKTDLRFGGQSLFVGQRGFESLLYEVGNYKDEADMKRDLDVLRLIDKVPSLDPFLLREHLRGNDIVPDASYFEISSADQRRMYEYASVEVSRLTALANGNSGGGKSASTGRMVAALLSSEVNEKLEPLRLTLNLNAEEFCEGVFSWRGFIYYKWSLNEFWPSLIDALRAIRAIRPIGKADPEQNAFIAASKNAIILGAKENSDAVRRVIAIYDDAYASLIERQDPKTFREFLLSAPSMFLDMGEKMGAMSHITSFWQYRFPKGTRNSADADELTTIFQDFVRSFGMETKLAA